MDNLLIFRKTRGTKVSAAGQVTTTMHIEAHNPYAIYGHFWSIIN
jgi:hypothetical protein